MAYVVRDTNKYSERQLHAATHAQLVILVKALISTLVRCLTGIDVANQADSGARAKVAAVHQKKASLCPNKTCVCYDESGQIFS